MNEVKGLLRMMGDAALLILSFVCIGTSISMFINPKDHGASWLLFLLVAFWCVGCFFASMAIRLIEADKDV